MTEIRGRGAVGGVTFALKMNGNAACALASFCWVKRVEEIPKDIRSCPVVAVVCRQRTRRRAQIAATNRGLLTPRRERS
nr:hypothetical protein Itr_chr02CG06230 [Ipomoea trifida]